MLASLFAACAPSTTPGGESESPSVADSTPAVTPEETPAEETEETSRYNATTSIPDDLNFGDK